MDRTRNMKQLEIMVDHLKHDNNMLKEEQMSAETTNEEVAFEKLTNDERA